MQKKRHLIMMLEISWVVELEIFKTFMMHFLAENCGITVLCYMVMVLLTIGVLKAGCMKRLPIMRH